MTWPFGRIGDHRAGEIELCRLGREEPWAFRNPFLGVRNDTVTFPDGRMGQHLSIHSSTGAAVGGVVMLPVVGSESVVFLRQYRHGPRRWEVELPRGFIDAGEDGEAAARRELQEECGIDAKKVIQLGLINADTALYGFDASCLFCEVPSLPTAAGDVFKAPPMVIPVAELASRIAGGEIRDAYSLACIGLASARGLLAGR